MILKIASSTKELTPVQYERATELYEFMCKVKAPVVGIEHSIELSDILQVCAAVFGFATESLKGKIMCSSLKNSTQDAQLCFLFVASLYANCNEHQIASFLGCRPVSVLRSATTYGIYASKTGFRYSKINAIEKKQLDSHEKALLVIAALDTVSPQRKALIMRCSGLSSLVPGYEFKDILPGHFCSKETWERLRYCAVA